MPRAARKKSVSGIHHIMMGGINQQDLFHSDEDRDKLLHILEKIKQTSQFELYAYCLMDNYIHLLLKEGQENLSKIVKRIGVAYVYWYNKKHERSGQLFQERFKSQNIENDRDFLRVLRYIHQKPIKVGLTQEMGKYPWSSYYAYGQLVVEDSGFINRQVALDLFDEELQVAVEGCIIFMNQSQEDSYLEQIEKKKYTDNEVEQELKKLLEAKSIHRLNQVENSHRDEVLRILRQMDGISIRQIERITGIGRNVIANA